MLPLESHTSVPLEGTLEAKSAGTDPLTTKNSAHSGSGRSSTAFHGSAAAVSALVATFAALWCLVSIWLRRGLTGVQPQPQALLAPAELTPQVTLSPEAPGISQLDLEMLVNEAQALAQSIDSEDALSIQCRIRESASAAVDAHELWQAVIPSKQETKNGALHIQAEAAARFDNLLNACLSQCSLLLERASKELTSIRKSASVFLQAIGRRVQLLLDTSALVEGLRLAAPFIAPVDAPPILSVYISLLETLQEEAEAHALALKELCIHTPQSSEEAHIGEGAWPRVEGAKSRLASARKTVDAAAALVRLVGVLSENYSEAVTKDALAAAKHFAELNIGNMQLMSITSENMILPPRAQLKALLTMAHKKLEMQRQNRQQQGEQQWTKQKQEQQEGVQERQRKEQMKRQQQEGRQEEHQEEEQKKGQEKHHGKEQRIPFGLLQHPAVIAAVKQFSSASQRVAMNYIAAKELVTALQASLGGVHSTVHVAEHLAGLVANNREHLDDALEAVHLLQGKKLLLDIDSLGEEAQQELRHATLPLLREATEIAARVFSGPDSRGSMEEEGLLYQEEAAKGEWFEAIQATRLELLAAQAALRRAATARSAKELGLQAENVFASCSRAIQRASVGHLKEVEAKQWKLVQELLQDAIQLAQELDEAEKEPDDGSVADGEADNAEDYTKERESAFIGAVVGALNDLRSKQDVKSAAMYVLSFGGHARKSSVKKKLEDPVVSPAFDRPARE